MTIENLKLFFENYNFTTLSKSSTSVFRDFELIGLSWMLYCLKFTLLLISFHLDVEVAPGRAMRANSLSCAAEFESKDAGITSKVICTDSPLLNRVNSTSLSLKGAFWRVNGCTHTQTHPRSPSFLHPLHSFPHFLLCSAHTVIKKKELKND